MKNITQAQKTQQLYNLYKLYREEKNILLKCSLFISICKRDNKFMFDSLIPWGLFDKIIKYKRELFYLILIFAFFSLMYLYYLFNN